MGLSENISFANDTLQSAKATAEQKQWAYCRDAYQGSNILQVRLSKVSNDIIKILKAQCFTAGHLDGEGAPQLQVTPNPPSLLAPLPDVLMQEQVVAVQAGVQLHSIKESLSPI